VINIGVQYLSYNEIAKKAERFLNDNSVKSIPVPIEEIIDLQYGIDIIPIPDLSKQCGVDGFIYSDFSGICVDDFVFQNRIYRYRFTLAHEIAHLILHKDYLRSCNFKNIDQWKLSHKGIDESDYNKMEYQGYSFGGLILVPRSTLEAQVKKHLPKIIPEIEKAKKKGVDRLVYLNYALDELATILSPVFEVSTDVLIRRIQYDNLEHFIP
jgi:Zn-dependent peptidase ImmA (M78 family)